jgi:hypothetical protein
MLKNHVNIGVALITWPMAAIVADPVQQCEQKDYQWRR